MPPDARPQNAPAQSYTLPLPHHPGTLTLLGPTGADAIIRQEHERGANDPGFWATLWPAGQALAAWLSRTLLLPDNARLVELGAGLAAPTLAAAARGANALATDADPRALHWVQRSAHANNLRHRVATAELDFCHHSAATRLHALADQHLSAPPDLIVAADVLYQPHTHQPLLALLDELAVPAAIALPIRQGAGAAEQRLLDAGFRSTRLDEDVRLLLRS